MVAHRGEPLDATLRQALVAELELQVRDDRREVRVAGALAEAVERSLHMAGAGLDGRHRVGHGATGVVVAVDADDRVVADVGLDVGDDSTDLTRQRSAVGVAQHEMRCAVDDCSFERAEREFGIVLVAVEEVLEVDEHHPAFAMEVLHRVGDHCSALVERCLERLDDLILGALGHDAYRCGVRLDQIAQRGVVVDLAARTARRAEGHQRRRAEVQFVLGAGEELDVLRVGAGPAAFDEVHAEQIELLGDAQLVVDRCRDTLHLEAVAQCGVEDLDVSWAAGWHGIAPEN